MQATHQYLHQLHSDIRHAVLGNAGTIVSFRVGAEDVPYLVREFQAKFEELDLLQLPNYSIYLKLMIDGTPSKPFSAGTLGIVVPDKPARSSWLAGERTLLSPALYGHAAMIVAGLFHANSMPNIEK